jgi:hypothetical protein
MKTISGVLAALLVSAPLWGQIKVATITDDNDPASKAVMDDLRSRLRDHPQQFTLVSTQDSDLSLIVQADCIFRKSKSDAFACFYTSMYAGGSTKTFMGGGIYGAVTSGELADNFLASIAQDIAERWNNMVRANAIEHLEACLMLTQSSCKVPDPLEPELKTKIINLSQYLQKGALKK